MSAIPPRSQEAVWRGRNTEIAVAVFRTLFLLLIIFSPQFLRARGALGALFTVTVILGALYNLALFVIYVQGLGFPRSVVVVVDLLLISLWIYFCRVDCARFFALYYPVTIVAGLWFGTLGALAGAVLASVLYTVAIYAAPLPDGSLAAPPDTILLQVGLLITTAGVLSVFLETQRQQQRALAESRAALDRYEGQMRAAREVDDIMRPTNLPRRPGLDIGHQFRPAATYYAGDYFTVVPLGDRRTGVCIADVCGKRSAGLRYLPTFHSTLRLALRRESSLAAVLREVNAVVVDEIAGKVDPEVFIGLCVVVLDLEAGSLSWANAGHEPPVLLPAAGDPLSLDGTGIVLGVEGDARYGERSLPLHTGDTLALFTDGVTEVADRSGRLLGRERFLEALQAQRSAPSASGMAQAAFEFANAFGRAGRRRDDMTLLIVRVTAEQVGAAAG